MTPNIHTNGGSDSRRHARGSLSSPCVRVPLATDPQRAATAASWGLLIRCMGPSGCEPDISDERGEPRSPVGRGSFFPDTHTAAHVGGTSPTHETLDLPNRTRGSVLHLTTHARGVSFVEDAA